MLFSRLIPLVGECSTQKRWCLWCVRITQHRGLVGCFFSSILRATNPRPSRINFGPLCSCSTLPPGAHDEWLGMKFYALALHGGACVSSRFLDRNCLSQLDVMWAALPALMLWAGESGLGLDSMLLRGKPHSCHIWEQDQFFLHFHPSY